MSVTTYDVYRVMRECRNFFEDGYLKTTFAISGGAIAPAALFRPGMYIAVEDSMFHNGVFRVGEGGVLEGLPAGVFDETFTGRVYFLNPSSGFLELCERIAEFIEKTPRGAFQSESMGEYSYTMAGGRNGAVLTWQEHFSNELREYRRMCTEVRC